jgi:hypothetical protein
MGGVGPADGVGSGLRESQVADLARLDELGHGPDRLLDGHGGIDAVLVVEVDVVEAEPLQRRVDARPDVLRLPVDAPAGGVGRVAHDAELGRQHHLLPPVADGPADQLLVGEGPVHVGGVEEGHAEVEGTVDCGDRLGLVGLAVELAHAHAAEALGRDDEPFTAQWAGGNAHGC